MLGASGTFDKPSIPWQAWHIRAFARPALTSPAAAVPAPAATKPKVRTQTNAFTRKPITINLTITKAGWPPSGGHRRDRSLLAVVPDTIQRSDQVVRDQKRTVGELRHVD